MTALQNLSIQNCTGLTGDIDITMCTDIRQIDASGTTININVPAGAPLTKYEVGTPTSITLVNHQQLSYNNVKVDNSTQLQNIVISNVSNNMSFKMFEKVMNL